MKFLKNKFVIISAAVVVAVALITAVLAMFGVTGPAKLILGTAAKPFQLIGSWAADAVNGFVSVFTDYGEIKAENDALKAQLESEKKENSDADALRAENEWLKGYINFATEHPTFELADARIIARGKDNNTIVLTLNRGSVHGIKKDMPVITEEGVFGQVVEVGLDWCRVTSIMKPENSVGAYVEGTDIGGLIVGDTDLVLGEECRMTYIDSDADIQVGDRVYTSGGDSSTYPPELYIGEVIKLETDESTRTFTAIVKPAVTGEMMDKKINVMIVTGYGGGGS